MARFVYRSRRWIARNAPIPCLAYCTIETQEMVVPFHASTKTRLHEMYHVHNTNPQHMLYWLPWLVDELKARTYPYAVMGKSSRVRRNDVAYVFISMVRTEGLSPVFAARLVFLAMKELRTPLTKEQRSKLWWLARSWEGTGFGDEALKAGLAIYPEEGG